METIDAYWEKILKINCSDDNDNFVQFHRDKNYSNNIDGNAYYVKFVNNKHYSILNRFKLFIEYRKNFNSYVNGINQLYNGIYITIEQLSEFYSILYNNALENEIILTEDIEFIDNFILDGVEKYNNQILLYKSSSSFIFSMNIFKQEIINFKLGWSLDSSYKKYIKNISRKYIFNDKYNYLCQNNELFINKKDLVDLLSHINFILNNVIEDNGKNILNYEI